MKNTQAVTKTTSVTTKALVVILATTCAVILPQIFHFAGEVSGIGGGIMGAAFLPMQIPVILAGLLCGPVVGILAGVLSPLVSFGVVGMPIPAMLPFIIVELAAYGLTAGLLGKKKTHVFFKLIIIQAVGRLARAGAVLAAVNFLGSTAVSTDNLWAFVTAGLPGILLQWALIPLIIYRVKGMKCFD